MTAHRLGLARETACQFGSVARTSRGLPFADPLDRVAFEHLGQHADATGVCWHEHAQLPGDDLAEEPIGPQAVPHACR